MTRTQICAIAALLCLLTGYECAAEDRPAVVKQPAAAKPKTKAKPKPEKQPVKVGDWQELFDGKSLNGWKIMKEDSFSAHGKIYVKDGSIRLGQGGPFTGILWTNDVPRENYEVVVDAMRFEGSDIFCGLTFPIGTNHCTLVLGGWGDCIVGLSSINHQNASENETTRIMSFKNKKWYDVRLRVTKAKIEVWIDDKELINLERADRLFTVYFELEPIRPLGFFSWDSGGALRSIMVRRLPKSPQDALYSLAP